MKFDNTEIFNVHNAIRGMRNPMNSHDKSDSYWVKDRNIRYFQLGNNDKELAQKLIMAGSEHRKFMRQIFVSVDITAPQYFWSEFDTYKVGTVANSTSKMHKLASTPITMDCFEMDDFEDFSVLTNDNFCGTTKIQWDWIICQLEGLRQSYNETKDKRYWKELLRLLPESWLQTRTVTMNFENLWSMVHQRTNHKLSEWSKAFIEWAKSIPYADDFIFFDEREVDG